jgi:uncharacterized membrane protein
MWEAIAIALGLSLANTGAAIFVIWKAMQRDWNQSYKMVLASMVIRYFLVSAIIFLILKFLQVNELAFALTFLISTFILLFGEIFFINSKSNFVNLRNKKIH